MATPLAKQIVLAARPKGQPAAADFRLEETPVPTLPPGGLLLRVLYLSLDPYMRGRMDDAKSYAKSVGVGEVMTAESVCEVLESDRAGYSPGDIVLAHTGWRTHAAWSGPALRKLDPKVAPITTGLGLRGPQSHRQAQARRDGRGGGCKRPRRLAGRPTRQDRRSARGRHRRRRR